MMQTHQCTHGVDSAQRYIFLTEFYSLPKKYVSGGILFNEQKSIKPLGVWELF